MTDEHHATEELREARENLQIALSSTALGWGVLDVQTGMLWQDERARAILGLSPDGPLTRDDFMAVVHPDDNELIQSDYERRAAGELDEPIEYRILRPDGETRIIRATGRLRRDDAGRPWQVTGTLQDVTKQRRDSAALQRLTEELEGLVAERTGALQHANTELASARDRFQKIFNANPMPKVIIDIEEGVYIDANPAFIDYMGLTREQVIGRRADELVFQQPIFKNSKELQEEFDQQGRILSVEATFEIRPGDTRTVLMSAARITFDGRGMMLAAITDITERKQAEQQVRQLASELTRAEEKERRRVSGILHDDLQQRLYAIQIELARLHGMLAKGDTEGIEALFNKVSALVPETINTARDLSIDLNPPILEGEGVAEALQWLATKMGREYGLPVRVSAAESFALADQGVRITLFHVVRELLFNVVKHAGQAEVEITLARRGDELEIEVKDDGQGFDARNKQEVTEGHGLTMSRQRLELFGGRMHIVSAPDEGTRAIIAVPLSADHDGNKPGESA